MIEHFYKQIPGWFDFQGIYSAAVNKGQNDSHFVEVGCFMGRSTAFMLVEIANSGKKIKFDVIDTFEGSPESLIHSKMIKDNSFKETDTLMDVFLRNIFPVKSYINQIIKDFSFNAGNLYSDNSLDFVFIDASHTYENVLKDIVSFYPKIKPGGIIAGHDYSEDWPGVKKAVIEFFSPLNLKVEIIGNSWLVKKL